MNPQWEFQDNPWQPSIVASDTGSGWGGPEHVPARFIQGEVTCKKMSKIDQWFTLIHYVIWLVVWNTWILFPYIGNFIIPTDFNSIIFQRGRAKNHQPAMLWWWWFWVMGIHRRITHGIQWIIWVKLPINGPRKTTGGGRWGRIQFSSSRKIDDHDY